MTGPEGLPPRRTARDFLVALAAVPGIGEEMDYLGQLLVDLDRGPDAEASWEMLSSRVHDQLDRIAELLGRNSVAGLPPRRG